MADVVRKIADRSVRLIARPMAWLYARLYALICGSYPNVRPWHYQWRALQPLHEDLREVLPLLGGRVLVVGRAGLGHRAMIADAGEVVGVDESPGPGITLVVHPGQPWPLPAASFDALLCIDALVRVADPAHALAEMARVLRPGALVVVRAPATPSAAAAIGPAGAPLRYYTADGLRQALGAHFTVTTLRREGGIGSALALLILGWMQAWADKSRVARLLQAFFLPLWIGFCAALNLAAVIVDAVDPTRAFYSSTLLVAVRKADDALPPQD